MALTSSTIMLFGYLLGVLAFQALFPPNPKKREMISNADSSNKDSTDNMNVNRTTTDGCDQEESSRYDNYGNTVSALSVENEHQQQQEEEKKGTRINYTKFKHKNKDIEHAINYIAVWLEIKSLQNLETPYGPVAQHPTDKYICKSVLIELFSTHRSSRLHFMLNYLSEPSNFMTSVNLADSVAKLILFALQVSLDRQVDKQSALSDLLATFTDCLLSSSETFFCDYILYVLTDIYIGGLLASNNDEEQGVEKQDFFSDSTTVLKFEQHPFMKPIVLRKSGLNINDVPKWLDKTLPFAEANRTNEALVRKSYHQIFDSYCDMVLNNLHRFQSKFYNMKRGVEDKSLDVRSPPHLGSFFDSQRGNSSNDDSQDFSTDGDNDDDSNDSDAIIPSFVNIQNSSANIHDSSSADIQCPSSSGIQADLSSSGDNQNRLSSANFQDSSCSAIIQDSSTSAVIRKPSCSQDLSSSAADDERLDPPVVDALQNSAEQADDIGYDPERFTIPISAIQGACADPYLLPSSRHARARKKFKKTCTKVRKNPPIVSTRVYSRMPCFCDEKEQNMNDRRPSQKKKTTSPKSSKQKKAEETAYVERIIDDYIAAILNNSGTPSLDDDDERNKKEDPSRKELLKSSMNSSADPNSSNITHPTSSHHAAAFCHNQYQLQFNDTGCHIMTGIPIDHTKTTGFYPIDPSEATYFDVLTVKARLDHRKSELAAILENERICSTFNMAHEVCCIGRALPYVSKRFEVIQKGYLAAINQLDIYEAFVQEFVRGFVFYQTTSIISAYIADAECAFKDVDHAASTITLTTDHINFFGFHVDNCIRMAYSLETTFKHHLDHFNSFEKNKEKYQIRVEQLCKKSYEYSIEYKLINEILLNKNCE